MIRLWRESAAKGLSWFEKGKGMDTPTSEPSASASSVAVADRHTTEPVAPPLVKTPVHTGRRRRLTWIVSGVVLIIVLVVGVPWVINIFNTVSTDDAYVNGHLTFVAPRVPGQVLYVLVDDNNRVNKGDPLVVLDPEPYEVQLNIAQSAVAAAQADLVAAQANARGIAAQARSLRFALQHAIEDVDNQIALLRSRVATLASKNASLVKAQDDYARALPLIPSGGIAKEEVDRRKEVLAVAQAEVEEALQGVYQIRVSLGLPPVPPGGDLAQTPPDLDQTFSSVRQAQSSLIQAVAQLGVTDSFDVSPKQMIANFLKRDPTGDIDKILARLVQDAPAVKQAEAKLVEAKRNLDQAKLNLRYTKVLAEIDGVVTHRNVNPGDNVVVGQSLMAVRSLTEIWIDANFKETQLGDLRIGQAVDLDVDMYGGRHRFQGRISGFTMGTGSTLALLPPENATGNFVKVVQRLPVRIEVLNYDPDKTPLFIGTSVEPTVHLNEKPTGPDAGKVLQPVMLTTVPTTQPETQP
jgi:membrane fusion protein (multidrug efflux system)